MFSTLDSSTESRNHRSAYFTCGVMIQTLAMSAAVLVSMLFPNQLPLTSKHYAITWLPTLTHPVKPDAKPPRKLARMVVPAPKPVEPPKLVASIAPTFDPPVVHHTVRTSPMPTAPLPPPPINQPVAPPRQEQVTVHTGIFGGAAETVALKRRAEQMQTGGFGSPQGLPARVRDENFGNVPKLGSFGLPEGQGVGNGTGGSHGVQGVVASAGFGSGSATSTGVSRGDGVYRVATGEFEKARQVAHVQAEIPRTPPPSDFQAIEILSKPSPIYTDQARQLGIQGEVALSVVFQSSGTIKILGVIRSLGYGLDQAAQQAAAKIRFKPAQRDGQPADFSATLRIEFRLAGQST
jgi:TonB family protein